MSKFDSVARVCAAYGIHPSGPGGTYTDVDFNHALDMAVAMRGGRLAEKVLAAMEQREADEFAHIFPPTQQALDAAEAAAAEHDEFARLFPPTG